MGDDRDIKFRERPDRSRSRSRHDCRIGRDTERAERTAPEPVPEAEPRRESEPMSVPELGPMRKLESKLEPMDLNVPLPETMPENLVQTPDPITIPKTAPTMQGFMGSMTMDMPLPEAMPENLVETPEPMTVPKSAPTVTDFMGPMTMELTKSENSPVPEAMERIITEPEPEFCETPKEEAPACEIASKEEEFTCLADHLGPDEQEADKSVDEPAEVNAVEEPAVVEECELPEPVVESPPALEKDEHGVYSVDMPDADEGCYLTIDVDMENGKLHFINIPKKVSKK